MEAVVAILLGSVGPILAVPATTGVAAILALHLPERVLCHALLGVLVARVAGR
jgi:hypothetical protein